MQSTGYVVYAAKGNSPRLYMGQPAGTWYSDLSMARLYPTEREAALAAKASATASGYEPYERAAGRK